MHRAREACDTVAIESDLSGRESDMAKTVESVTLLELLAGADDQPALVAPERPTLTYGQLRANVVSLAAQLNTIGLGQGDRIAIAMPNGPDMVLAYCGTTLAGTAAPLN